MRPQGGNLRAASPLDFQGVRPQSTVSPKMQRMRIKPSEEVQWELISLGLEKEAGTLRIFSGRLASEPGTRVYTKSLILHPVTPAVQGGVPSHEQG